MVTHRIIPTLLCRGSLLVKGQKFSAWRSVGSVTQGMKVMACRSVDEVLLMDTTATSERRMIDMDMVKQITSTLFTPLTVGGGIRSVAGAREAIRNGADKVAINSHASPELVSKIADALGSQAVVVVIDYLNNGKVYDHAEGKEAKGAAVTWAKAAATAGAGEIVMQSVEREGTLEGYDLDMIEAVSGWFSVPVIHAGGCGTYEHMHEALDAGADAVAAGAMFQFTEQTPKGAAEYLSGRGWDVRT